MSDETVKLSAKSWNRTVDSINKVGYSDGVVDGEAASFQSSFDLGYKQGFEFGFALGVGKLIASDNNFRDPRGINCQICLNSDTKNENIVNLYNKQYEANNDHIK